MKSYMSSCTYEIMIIIIICDVYVLYTISYYDIICKNNMKLNNILYMILHISLLIDFIYIPAICIPGPVQMRPRAGSKANRIQSNASPAR